MTLEVPLAYERKIGRAKVIFYLVPSEDYNKMRLLWTYYTTRGKESDLGGGIGTPTFDATDTAGIKKAIDKEMSDMIRTLNRYGYKKS